jgi:hypothetical protein
MFAGRVFLTRRDAESFARKLPDGLTWEIEETNACHNLVLLDGDIDAVKRICDNEGIRTFIWRKP